MLVLVPALALFIGIWLILRSIDCFNNPFYQRSLSSPSEQDKRKTWHEKIWMDLHSQHPQFTISYYDDQHQDKNNQQQQQRLTASTFANIKKITINKIIRFSVGHEEHDVSHGSLRIPSSTSLSETTTELPILDVAKESHFTFERLGPQDFWLEDLTAVYLITSKIRAFSHTMLTFEFFNHYTSKYSRITFSFHARCAASEKYDGLRGLFRHFSLMMLVFEEHECLVYRQELEHEQIHRFPLLLDAQQRQKLFVHLCTWKPSETNINGIYHTVTNNCCRPISMAIQYATGLSFSNVWVVLRGLDDVLVSNALLDPMARTDRMRYHIVLPTTTIKSV